MAGPCSNGLCDCSKIRRDKCWARPASTLPTSTCGCLHQANIRILDAATEALGIDRNRVVTHLDRYGNTSAGSVPIALDESLRSGRFDRGDLLLMSGFGGGLSWGTALVRW